MKLKKIASLMLAGIMAVSMLAGCKSGTNGDDTNSDVTPSTSSIVEAMNNGQSATNKVKVTFTSNPSVEAGLTKVLKGLGDGAKSVTDINLAGAIAKQVGITADTTGAMSTFAAKDAYKSGTATLADPDGVDGRVRTLVWAYRVDNAKTEEAARRMAVAAIDTNVISKLVDTTFVSKSTKDGDKYADYSYTGTIDMVTVENTDGTTNYFVAYTLTQTSTVSTFEQA